MSQKKCILDIYKWKNDDTSPVGCKLNPNENGNVDLPLDSCGSSVPFTQFLNNTVEHKKSYSGKCSNADCYVEDTLWTQKLPSDVTNFLTKFKQLLDVKSWRCGNEIQNAWVDPTSQTAYFAQHNTNYTPYKDSSGKIIDKYCDVDKVCMGPIEGVCCDGDDNFCCGQSCCLKGQRCNYTWSLATPLAGSCETVNPDECQLMCGKNAKCYNGKCQCNPGWTGRNCNSNACTSEGVDKCGSHGKCKQVGGIYKCVCNDGWSGKNCLIPCPPCDDGKQCNTTSGKCECPHNSWGPNCENPACGGSPCGDHQMCQNDNCVCAGGWWGGPLCLDKPSPCDTKYKHPFDSKEATPSDYMDTKRYNTFCNGQTRGACNRNLTCDCTLGWEGDQCEKPPSCKDWVPQRLSLSMNNISMAKLEVLRKNDKTNFDKACKEINKTTPDSLLKGCQNATQCEDDLKTICEKPDSFTTEAESWLDGLKKTCSSPPPPQTTKYSCDSKTGLCKVSASGSFSDKSKCQDACKKPSPHKSLAWLWILLGVFGALILVGIVIVYSTRSR